MESANENVIMTTKNSASVAHQCFVIICRILIVVLGLVSMVLGCYSHFNSYWRDDNEKWTSGPIYSVCGLDNIREKNPNVACPSIYMEYYYVFVAMSTTAFSCVMLICSFCLDWTRLKTFDIASHAVAALLLVAAGIVYIISAVQIKALIHESAPEDVQNERFYTDEKLAVGGMTIFNGIIYGGLALALAEVKSH